MRNIAFALLAAGLLWPAAASAAYEDEGLSETVTSTETAKNADEEDDQTVLQENDEDLAAFVTDYIRKDTQLKGAFFIEEKATRKILKLSLASVDPRPVNGEGGVKKVTAVFKDAAGKKYTAVFHLQNGPWGGLDIFKLEIKASAPPAKAGKQG
ncbi:MAG: hypothetical protein A2081_00820 [Elusimicrobia bacterium GWC2_61_19]|nr:MAG: hypothetical protein A2081_00820 [Elusimicrobia bacterium GWC2_61_19]